jgi:hypothetical protein
MGRGERIASPLFDFHACAWHGHVTLQAFLIGNARLF